MASYHYHSVEKHDYRPLLWAIAVFVVFIQLAYVTYEAQRLHVETSSHQSVQQSENMVMYKLE